MFLFFPIGSPPYMDVVPFFFLFSYCNSSLNVFYSYRNTTISGSFSHNFLSFYRISSIDMFIPIWTQLYLDVVPILGTRPRLSRYSLNKRDRDSYSRIFETETRKMCIFDTETRKLVQPRVSLISASSGGSLIFSFSISSFTYQKERTAWCSHNLWLNSAVPTRIVGTENWFLIGCSDKFVGTTFPTKIVRTPNGGFLLVFPTNLLEQTTIYNSVRRGMQHFKKYTVPTNLWEQPIGNQVPTNL